MTAKNVYFLASVGLIAFAFLNFSRAALDMPFSVGALEIPILASWIASGVVALLSVIGFYLSDRL